MKKAFTMALTAAMIFVMGVTAFALPGAVEPEEIGGFDAIINFVAGILRWFGDIIAVIFK